jgi:hypothetical protein
MRDCIPPRDLAPKAGPQVPRCFPARHCAPALRPKRLISHDCNSIHHQSAKQVVGLVAAEERLRRGAQGHGEAGPGLAI